MPGGGVQGLMLGRLLVCVSVLLVGFAACASAAMGPPPTRLSIAVYPRGRGGSAVRHYRLRCDPAGGTVPRPVRACRTLARLRHPFAPVPEGSVCAQIALGSQEAIVTGRVRGRRVWVRLRLLDSCQIARWQRVATAVPGFPGDR